MRRVSRFALAAALTLAAPIATAVGSETDGSSANCRVPTELRRLQPPLTHSAERIAQGAPLTVVAIGSSSTQGVGASAPPLNYPNRLEAELKERFPGTEIRVLNRGKGGEDAAEELARLDREVIAEHPDLVIWQVGTNAVLRRDDLAADAEMIERGVALLQQRGSDILLMDMQYAPRVVDKPAYATMEQLLADVAKRMRVGLFRRFEIMRHWAAADPPEAGKMIGADGLHMTDRGYGCLAAGLAEALASNWASQQRSAESPQTASVGSARAQGGPAPVAGGRP